MRWIFNVIVLFAILATIHCALAPSPDLHHIPWLPNAIATWANEYPAFRNFPAFGFVAMSLYFCVSICLQNSSSEKTFGARIVLLNRGFCFWSAVGVPADLVADPLFRSL